MGTDMDSVAISSISQGFFDKGDGVTGEGRTVILWMWLLEVKVRRRLLGEFIFGKMLWNSTGSVFKSSLAYGSVEYPDPMILKYSGIISLKV